MEGQKSTSGLASWGKKKKKAKSVCLELPKKKPHEATGSSEHFVGLSMGCRLVSLLIRGMGRSGFSVEISVLLNWSSGITSHL